MEGRPVIGDGTIQLASVSLSMTLCLKYRTPAVNMT